MKKKKPAILFYPGDWLKDPNLTQCSPATRGIWIHLLCLMHENGNSGRITGEPEGLARACACTVQELFAAVFELKKTKTAEIRQFRHGNVTQLSITNRRMFREAQYRENQRIRKTQQRQKEKCHANVPQLSRDCPPLSSFSSSFSIIERENIFSLSNRKIQTILENFGLGHLTEKFLEYIRSFEGYESIDWEFYLEKFLKTGLKQPVRYFQRCIENEEKPLRKIPQPPKKKFSIPEQYAIIPQKSPCLNCHQSAQEIMTDEGFRGVFCEYCGELQVEAPPDVIHSAIEEAQKKLKEANHERETENNETAYQ